MTQSAPSIGSCVPPARLPAYWSPDDVARFHSIAGNAAARLLAVPSGAIPGRFDDAASDSGRNVWLGGSRSSAALAREVPPSFGTATESIIAGPTTSATALVLRAARRR